jgi:hypothetical protein
MATGALPGRRRAGRPKVDSNEVLREFRASGWTPRAALDSASADPGILAAVRACVRPRGDVEAHARRLCAFVFAHLRLASVSMVDIFSADLWGTAVDPEWAAELLALSDEDVALLSVGRLERAWQSPSLAAFVRAARDLDLPRECAVPQAAAERGRFPLVAMTEKKAHEVRVLATVAAHLAYQHSLKVAAPPREETHAPVSAPSRQACTARAGVAAPLAARWLTACRWADGGGPGLGQGLPKRRACAGLLAPRPWHRLSGVQHVGRHFAPRPCIAAYEPQEVRRHGIVPARHVCRPRGQRRVACCRHRACRGRRRK